MVINIRPAWSVPPTIATPRSKQSALAHVSESAAQTQPKGTWLERSAVVSSLPDSRHRAACDFGGTGRFRPLFMMSLVLAIATFISGLLLTVLSVTVARSRWY
jgi:hypothetical protein